MLDDLTTLKRQNAEDRAAAVKWMAEATTEDKLRVWMTIQRPYDDPVMEIMSRFAQLAFGEIFSADLDRQTGVKD